MAILSVFFQVLIATILVHVSFVKGDQCEANKETVNQVQAPNNATGVAIDLLTPYKNSTCSWQITAPPGYIAVVKLSVLTFSSDCASENFKVFDGTSTSDELIAMYCIQKPYFPTVEVWFTSVNGRLQLKQGNSDTGPKLRMQVVAVKKPSCNDGKLSASSKEAKFTSPNYPNGSPPGLSCQWLIEAPPGKYLKLTFKDVSVSSCSDVLRVYDGEAEAPEDLLQKRCSIGNTRMYVDEDKPIYSYGDRLLVVLKTVKYLKTYSNKGFEAIYSAVDGGKECGPGKANTNNIELSSPTGTITSPGFPVSVPPDAFTCVWRLRAPKGQVAKVDLDSLLLRGSIFGSFCKSNLEMYTNIGPEVFEIADYMCDNKNVFQTVVSVGRRMEIIYKQQELNASRRKPKGFNIEYSTQSSLSQTGSCKANGEGTIDVVGDYGTITSPNYPKYHPTNMKCRWKVSVTPGNVIEVTTTTYQLDSDCKKQWIRIYDGPDISSPELVQLCKTSRKSFFSSSNRIVIEFVTNGDTKSEGFYITYATRKAKPKPYACSMKRDINAASGKIASQRFPLKYSNYAFCRDKIKLPNFSSLVNLTFTSFDTEPDGDKCDKDYVEVRSLGYKLGKFCGKKNTPFSVMSKNNEMEIDFRTDASGRYPGYEATFTSVRDFSFGNCTEPGKDNVIPMTTPKGTIFSPRYPDSYPPNMKCKWVLQPPKDKFIRLIFDDIWLQKCAESSVVIREMNSKKIIARLCEYPSTPYVVFSSPENGLIVEFTSAFKDSFFYQNKGFTAHYETFAQSQFPLSASCGQNSLKQKLKGPGSIASYDYPLKYENNVKCTWVISTSDSNRFKIKFDFMDIEPSPGCKDDYVQIRDGGYSFSESLGKFCGSTKPDSFKSSESSIFVEFKTNGTGRYGGFKLSYEETYNVRTIVLISVFSVLGGIGLICLIGYCILKCCCDSDSGGPEFEQVGLKPTED